MRRLAIRAALLVAAMVVFVAGILASTAVADPSNAIEKARPIVVSNVGDIPAPNEEGIANNIDNLPLSALNSTTRNPICGAYTGGPPS